MRTALVLALCCWTGWLATAQSAPAAAIGNVQPGQGADPARRGWHFYDDPAKEEAPGKAAPPAPAGKGVAKGVERPELARFRRLQQDVEELREVAIINPTEENVRRYMTLEAKVVRNASWFADMSQRIAWADPGLDPTTEGRPVNANALDVFERTQEKLRADAVADLGRDHVLMFFYRSDCPYCHAFAPVLRNFGSRYRIQVMAVSLDGGPMPGFPAARPDNGTARTLGVSQVPALFVAQPDTGNIAPLGFGVLSETQLLERLAVMHDTRTAPRHEALFWPDH